MPLPSLFPDSAAGIKRCMQVTLGDFRQQVCLREFRFSYRHDNDFPLL